MVSVHLVNKVPENASVTHSLLETPIYSVCHVSTLLLLRKKRNVDKYYIKTNASNIRVFGYALTFATLLSVFILLQLYPRRLAILIVVIMHIVYMDKTMLANVTKDLLETLTINAFHADR